LDGAIIYNAVMILYGLKSYAILNEKLKDDYEHSKSDYSHYRGCMLATGHKGCGFKPD
jgi:hypothetical protein